jgi:hypothetical protein
LEKVEQVRGAEGIILSAVVKLFYKIRLGARFWFRELTINKGQDEIFTYWVGVLLRGQISQKAQSRGPALKDLANSPNRKNAYAGNS